MKDPICDPICIASLDMFETRLERLTLQANDMLKSRRVRRGAFGGLFCLVNVGLLGVVRADAIPEYRKAETPVSPELKGERTATDSIGAIPESLLDQYDPYDVLPRKWLPKLRERYVPKTGQPFIDDLKFEVHPRFYYFHRDVEGEGIQESAAFGGEMGLETGWYNDWFRIGLTGYTSQKIYGPSDRDGIGLLAPGQDGYTVLGEAYVDVKLNKSLLRAGRTRIDVPYINALDFRMTPQTFEAVGGRVGEFENLKLGVAHIFKIKGRTDTDFESMSEAAGVVGKERGVSAISLRYNFSEDCYIALTEQYGWDMFNTLYIEGERLIEFSDRFKLRMGAQFTDQRSVGSELLGDFSTQAAGVKLALQYCNLTTAISYQWTGDGNDILKPWGGTPAYNSSIIQDFDRAGEQSLRIGLNYDLAPHGLEGVSIDTAWIMGDTPDSGKHASPDQDEFDFTIDYRPDMELFDGVWLRARYAYNPIDGGADIEDIRFILNYSYDF